MVSLPTKWLREPLLHFAVLGAAIFLIEAAVSPAADERRVITVTPAVQQELHDSFQQVEGRAPTEDELDRMIDRWVAEEVLYRQGRALGLDEGDAMIRERVVQRTNVLLQNSAVVEAPMETELRAWFDAHPERFDTPVRFDFVTKRVVGGEAAAEALAASLRRALETGEGALQPDGPLASYAERPRPNVVALFGEPFATALEDLPEFEWQAVRSLQGWHVVRLDGIWPAQAADFEAVRDAVAADWRREAMAEEAAAALRRITGDYEVVRPGSRQKGAGESEAQAPDARISAAPAGAEG